MSTRKDIDALKAFREKCARIKNSTHINPLEKVAEKNDRIDRAKKDFKYFVEYYFEHYAGSATPDFHIKIARRVRRNNKYKGWLKWARGHAKSVVAIVLLPLWLWINQDIKFLLVVGQTQDKAELLLSDLQAEFESNQRLINDYGAQKVQGSWESGFFKTASGFKAKAIGMGQDPRGIRVGADRPDMIVADDWETKDTIKNPMRQDEYAQWFLRAVIPTMDDKNRRVLICQNHFAPRMIFSLIIELTKAWEINRVNAYDPVTYKPTWPEKYSRWHFKELEEELGVLAVQAEYNHEPHVEGKLFVDAYFNYGKMPRLSSFQAITGRWDVAFAGTSTSDFNAVRVWGLKDGKKWLIDCFVKQSKVREPLQWIADFQKNLPDNVKVQFGFEAQFWNEEIYRTIDEVEVAKHITLNLIKIERSKVNKYERILEMLPQYQNGRVYFNEKLKSSSDFQQGLAQLKGIEPGYRTKDDAPDADKEAFDYLDRFQSSGKRNHKFNTAESRKF